MLSHRLRRCPNIISALADYIVSAGWLLLRSPWLHIGLASQPANEGADQEYTRLIKHTVTTPTTIFSVPFRADLPQSP